MEDLEVYKAIEGYEGYYISNKGSLKNDKILFAGFGGKYRVKNASIKKYNNNTGKYKLYLLHGKKSERIAAHVLVAKSFILNPDDKHYVNHIDGNKSNNCYTNLEWVTHKENIQHCVNVLGKIRKKINQVT